MTKLYVLCKKIKIVIMQKKVNAEEIREEFQIEMFHFIERLVSPVYRLSKLCKCHWWQ